MALRGWGAGRGECGKATGKYISKHCQLLITSVEKNKGDSLAAGGGGVGQGWGVLSWAGSCSGVLGSHRRPTNKTTFEL